MDFADDQGPLLTYAAVTAALGLVDCYFELGTVSSLMIH
jgi:hypothetical protein